jgi:predicted tellurium resistance membrane protein TerC
MAFAVDNVLAAVALVGPPPAGWPKDALHPKLWVILTGGMLGVILTRFAARACVTLVARFPRLEPCAYLIVLLVAGKLILEWEGTDFHDKSGWPFWVFWMVLLGCLGVAFVPYGDSKRPGLRTED